MRITRRNLLSRLAAGAVSGAALQAIGECAFGNALPKPCTGSSAEPIFLSRNENAYGPSEKALQAMQEALSDGNRYVRAEYDSLVEQIAGVHQVKAERVILGCGSSEILCMTAAAVLGPGKNLVQPSPTYSVLGEFARSIGSDIISVPLNKLYEHDLDAMHARCDRSTGLVYICNPNNPTGSLTPRKAIETFVGKIPAHTVVLIDEAYHHYVSGASTYTSFLDRPFDDSRLIVTRTFSKIYGLAGMRVGYAVIPKNLTPLFTVERLRSGVGILSVKAAAAALEDSESVRRAAKRNANDRQEFMNQVNARMLRAVDSHTNFVMLNPLRPVDEALDHLRTHNIFVAPRIPALNYMRVSLGTPKDMLQFWRAWDLMPPHKMVM